MRLPLELECTDKELEGIALAHYHRFCIRQRDNKMINQQTRAHFVKIAERVVALQQLRGDKVA